MANEAKFVEGLFIKTVETQYGNIDKLSFQADRFINYLNENKNEKGYVNIDLLSKRDGGKYAKLDNFVPKSNGQSESNEAGDSLPF